MPDWDTVLRTIVSHSDLPRHKRIGKSYIEMADCRLAYDTLQHHEVVPTEVRSVLGPFAQEWIHERDRRRIDVINGNRPLKTDFVQFHNCDYINAAHALLETITNA